ncbi:MAG: DMT family transporter [Planctomycetota bacterium]|nr:DMT family transporter [Planctomycetota bacterium]
MILAVLAGYGFGQLWKIAQRRGIHAPTAIAVNYLVVGSLLSAWYLRQGEALASPEAARMGALIGALFVISMLVMTRALVKGSVGPVLTSFRLAIVVPVTASVLVWGERLGPAQAAGIVLALTGLVLMTRGAAREPRTEGDSRKSGVLLLLPVLLCQGLGQCAMDAVKYRNLNDERLHVLLAVGWTAGLLGTLVVAAMRYRPRAQDLAMGAFIGVYNTACLSLILTALGLFGAKVYFPVQGCAVVMLDNLTAHFLWQEKLTRLGLAGAVLGAVSMLLVF